MSVWQAGSEVQVSMNISTLHLPPGQTASKWMVSSSGYPPALSIHLVRLGWRTLASQIQMHPVLTRVKAGPEENQEGALTTTNEHVY